MRKAFIIFSAGILSGMPRAGQCQESSGTPIMGLEEILGFEPSTESATARKGGTANGNSLVIQERKSQFQLHRPVYLEAVFIFNEQYRTAQSGWISAICISPRDADKSPAVFLLDEEIRYVRTPPNQPEDLAWDEWEGRYLMRTPLAGHLVGAGYSVIIPVQKTIQRYRRIPSQEWVGLIEKFKKLKSIDETSFFLVSTREYAELAFKLAGQTEFAGVVVEEPAHLIFGEVEEPSQEASGGRRQGGPPFYIAKPPPEGTQPQPEDFTADIARRYLGYLNRVKAPLLMIMARDSIYAEFNARTLLWALSQVGTDFRVIMLDQPARILRSESDRRTTMTQIRRREETDFEESAQTVGFSYDLEGMESWLARMLYFLRERSLTKPEPLPIPDPDLARQKRMENLMRTAEPDGLGPSEPFRTSDGNFEDSENTDEGGEEP